MKPTPNDSREPSSFRTSRSARQLQTAVHRYLDDCGEWADNVGEVIRELYSMSRELDAREKSLRHSEQRLQEREEALDQLLASLSQKESYRVVPSQHSSAITDSTSAPVSLADSPCQNTGSTEPPAAAAEQLFTSHAATKNVGGFQPTQMKNGNRKRRRR